LARSAVLLLVGGIGALVLRLQHLELVLERDVGELGLLQRVQAVGVLQLHELCVALLGARQAELIHHLQIRRRLARIEERAEQPMHRGVGRDLGEQAQRLAVGAGHDFRDQPRQLRRRLAPLLAILEIGALFGEILERTLHADGVVEVRGIAAAGRADAGEQQADALRALENVEKTGH
jgi:hypothetical protein